MTTPDYSKMQNAESDPSLSKEGGLSPDGSLDNVEYVLDEDFEETDNQNPGADNEIEDELDSSGPNFSQAEYDDSDVGNPEGGSANLWVIMFKVLLNPIEGWKSLRRKHVKPQEVQSNLFYPLATLFALSKFAGFFYLPDFSLSSALVDAVCAFVSFFFGYFLIMILLKALMPKADKGKINTPFAQSFVAMSLSTLCLFFIVIEILPMLWAVLIFLPLWTVYAVCRGARFFKFDNAKQITATTVLCLSIVAVPVLLDWALKKIL